MSAPDEATIPKYRDALLAAALAYAACEEPWNDGRVTDALHDAATEYGMACGVFRYPYD